LFELDHAQPVRLQIFDLGGRHIRTIHAGPLAAGSHSFHWDGCSDQGEGVASGSYFCRLVGPTWSESQRVMLVR
jgi:flagellar hook assembly protein FlgD